MGGSKYIRCIKCGWSQVRVNCKPGTVQCCASCGFAFTKVGVSPTKTSGLRPHQQEPPPGGKGKGKGKANNNPGSRRNRWSQQAAARQQQHQPTTQRHVTTAESEGAEEDARSKHAKEISKYETMLDTLDDAVDSELAVQLQQKIKSSKAAIIGFKGLDQRVIDLQSYLDRRSLKVLSLRKTLQETHDELCATQLDINDNSELLKQLKQEQIDKIAAGNGLGSNGLGQMPEKKEEDLSAAFHALKQQLDGALAQFATLQTSHASLSTILTQVQQNDSVPAEIRANIALNLSPVTSTFADASKHTSTSQPVTPLSKVAALSPADVPIPESPSRQHMSQPQEDAVMQSLLAEVDAEQSGSGLEPPTKIQRILRPSLSQPSLAGAEADAIMKSADAATASVSKASGNSQNSVVSKENQKPFPGTPPQPAPG